MAIKHKRTSTANYTWQSTDLAEGQIGLNIADGTLHFKKSNNTIVNLSAGGSISLDNLTDVTLTTSSDQDVLIYNSATSQWINSPIIGNINAALDAINGV